MNPDTLSQTCAKPAASRVHRAPRVHTILEEILDTADIRLDGGRPWDIRVQDDRFCTRVLSSGTLGFGESYMDGWWDCEALDELFFRAIRAQLVERIRIDLRTWLSVATAAVLNFQNKSRAWRVGRQHYDLGNDFFQAMLDPAMQYSCGYFQDTTDLALAQRLKMELICRKLGLHPGMRLLDIGCGWGGLAKYAAEQHGCRVIGITISREQEAYASAVCEGLPIEIRLQDYRDITETFDRVVSVGMVEHVGSKNFRTYMETVSRCLGDKGLFLCHTIGDTRSRTTTDPWISRYIFPNSLLPSVSQLTRAAEGHFVLEDLHNFGAYYDATLLAWEINFRASWDRFESRYGERFYRMWRFYLLSCAAAFRARSIELYQLVFSKRGVLGGYTRPDLRSPTALSLTRAED